MGVNTMRYKIIGRVIKGRETVGYRVIGEDKKERIISKEDLIKVVKQGLVVNAVYNRSTKTIGGIKGVDLRSLPVIRYIDVMNSKKDKAIKEKVKTNSKNNSKNNKMESLKDKKVITRSNHQLAKEYQMKADLLGNDRLKFRLLDGDRVELYRVNGGEDTGRLVIPSFITGVGYFEYPLSKCKYSEIYIDNQEGVEFNANSLCGSMESDELKVVFKNPSMVVNTERMFYKCELLTKLDISNLNISNVTDMGEMFYECELLEEIAVSKWNISKVTNMRGMFYGCKALKGLSINTLDVSKVENMSEMFSGCKSLKELDLNKWDVSKVTDMSEMFKGCELLEKLHTSNWDVSNVENMYGIIKGCKSLDLKYSCKQEKNNNHELAQRYIMDRFVKGLDAELKFRLSICDRVELYSVENKVSTGRLIIPSFITDLDIDITEEHEDAFALNGCRYSEVFIDNSDRIPFNASGLCGYMESKKLKVVFKNPKKVVNMTKMFYNCKAYEIDVSELDTSNVSDMEELFRNCVNLSKVDVSKWDVSKVKYISFMFDRCENLSKIDIGRWDTSNVTNAEYMFIECKRLRSIDLSKWDVSKVVNISCMFDSCESLREVDVSTWDLGNVEEAWSIFENCKSLEKVDARNWVISDKAAVYDVFENCNELKEVYVNKANLDTFRKELGNRIGIIKCID